MSECENDSRHRSLDYCRTCGTCHTCVDERIATQAATIEALEKERDYLSSITAEGINLALQVELTKLEAQHTALAEAARAYLNSDTPDPRDQDQVDECEITRDALAALIGTKEENNA